MNKKGQSLVEVLVSVGIIIMGIVPIIGLVSVNARVSSRVKEEAIGVELAREGIEVVRNIRDSNWSAGDAWDTDLDDGSYTIELNTTTPSWTLSNTSVTSCIDSAVVAGNLHRLITLESQADGGIEVISEVCSSNNNYQLVEVLYDWHP
jgi:Tfp pilus assembly protein PilV